MLRYLNETEKAMMNELYGAFNKILDSGSYELIAHLYDEMDEFKYEVGNVFEPMLKKRKEMTKQLTNEGLKV